MQEVVSCGAAALRHAPHPMSGGKGVHRPTGALGGPWRPVPVPSAFAFTDKAGPERIGSIKEHLEIAGMSSFQHAYDHRWELVPGLYVIANMGHVAVHWVGSGCDVLFEELAEVVAAAVNLYRVLLAEGVVDDTSDAHGLAHCAHFLRLFSSVASGGWMCSVRNRVSSMRW